MFFESNKKTCGQINNMYSILGRRSTLDIFSEFKKTCMTERETTGKHFKIFSGEESGHRFLLKGSHNVASSTSFQFSDVNHHKFLLHQGL
jgi:hypothetical protein